MQGKFTMQTVDFLLRVPYLASRESNNSTARALAKHIQVY